MRIRFLVLAALLTQLALPGYAQAADPYFEWLKQQGQPGQQAKPDPGKQATPPPQLAPADGSSKEGRAEVVDFGDFVPVYSATNRYGAFQQQIRTARPVEKITESLNQLFALPTNVEVAFAECGVANAFYTPSDRRLRICYELIEVLADYVNSMGYAKADSDSAFISLIVFVLFHELGHALIDVLDLPFTGREEDAADQLSTYMMLAIGSENVSPVHFAVAMYQSGGVQSDQAFADEHSLGPQRAYNVACWVYGSGQGSDASRALLGQYLPDGRRAKCTDEYQKLTHGWQKLLAPYIKQ